MHQAVACQHRKRPAAPSRTIANDDTPSVTTTTAAAPQSPQTAPRPAGSAFASSTPDSGRPSNNKRRASKMEQQSSEAGSHVDLTTSPAAAHVDLTNSPSTPQHGRQMAAATRMDGRAVSHASVEIMDSSDDEDDSNDGRKPAAQSRQERKQSRNDQVIDLMDDDDDMGAVEQQWTCPRCTLLNPMTSVHCGACNNRNPSASPRPPDPVRRERLIGGDDDWMMSGGGMGPVQEHFMYSGMSGGGNRNNNNNNAAAYLGGGALVGGILGAAASYARGRPAALGAFEGAMQGAISGAFASEMFRDGDNAHMQQQQSQSQGSRRSSRRTNPPIRTTRTVRHGNGISTTTTTSWSSSSSLSQTRRGNSRGMDPVTSMMMQSMLATSPGRFHRAGLGASVDGMSYEQLLARFGDGSEMMGASDQQVASLPVAAVDDTPLPQDSCQCSICLENFQTGDKRKILPCLHSFHESCVDKWLKQNGACPICKHRLQGGQN